MAQGKNAPLSPKIDQEDEAMKSAAMARAMYRSAKNCTNGKYWVCHLRDIEGLDPNKRMKRYAIKQLRRKK